MFDITLHIGDLVKDWSKFNNREWGIGLRLLFEYYDKEQPLSTDMEELEYLAEVHDEEDRAALRKILKRVFVLDEEAKVYRQKRADKEISAYRVRCVGAVVSNLKKAAKNHPKYWPEWVKDITPEQFLAHREQFQCPHSGKLRFAGDGSDSLPFSSDTDPTGPDRTRNGSKSDQNGPESAPKASLPTSQPPSLPTSQPPSTDLPPRGGVGTSFSGPSSPPQLKPKDDFGEKKKGGRARDAVMDAIAVACGYDLGSVTGSMWGRIAKAKKDIKSAEPELTADIITATAAAYREAWPSVELTPTSLSMHWAKFRTAKKEKGGGGALPVGPPGWEDAALQRGFPTHLGWEFLQDHEQQQIIRDLDTLGGRL